MAKKKDTGGIIYSTDPGFDFNSAQEEVETPPPSKQRLTIRTDSKQRKGKLVTLVEGFMGKNEDLEALGKQLKTACGTGGSVKDGLVILQGNQQEKMKQLLSDWGYKVK